MNKVLKLEILSFDSNLLFPLCGYIDLLSIVLKSILINGTCIKEGFNRIPTPRTHLKMSKRKSHG